VPAALQFARPQDSERNERQHHEHRDDREGQAPKALRGMPPESSKPPAS